MLNQELFPFDEFAMDMETQHRIQEGVLALCAEHQNDGRGGTRLYHRFLPSPVGPMLALASDKGVILLEFLDTLDMIADEIRDLRHRYGYALSTGDHPHLEQAAKELDDYFGGARQEFTLPLDTPGTPFDLAVWTQLQRIPYGRTCSYGELAREIGNGAHARIVGSANHRNRVSIVIPCHRVIGANGTLTGYGGGLPRKRWLLEFESLHAQHDISPDSPHESVQSETKTAPL